ncbi:hypothetical protein AVEN_19560-1 [Araneus ventricosus]|uniref:Uncharacterized protein n=1 Tax=Araneus ventricosus TaxID=182803 RepID=A0A4Y2R0W9_ARAVE|nr:hypothetical protein AVEN_19560-1 [Araneus ventricosus]
MPPKGNAILSVVANSRTNANSRKVECQFSKWNANSRVMPPSKTPVLESRINLETDVPLESKCQLSKLNANSSKVVAYSKVNANSRKWNAISESGTPTESGMHRNANSRKRKCTLKECQFRKVECQFGKCQLKLNANFSKLTILESRMQIESGNAN